MLINKWVFDTSVSDLIKYILNRMNSSKYVLKGKCKKCGECCKNILLSDENGYIKDEIGFQKLKKRNKKYNHFEICGVAEELDKALLFKCKSLNEKNLCKDYFFRSLCCRDYPSINHEFIRKGGVTLDGCGYYFDVDKKFKEYLK